MAENGKFPYAIIIRDIGNNKYETDIQLLEKKEVLRTIQGIFRSKIELTNGMYLLEIEGNFSEKEDLKVLLYGNKVMIFSKHMKHVVSNEKRKVSIVDMGVPTVIDY